MSKKRKKKSPVQDEKPKVNLKKEVAEIDPELEARILKEADNDFFDEKPAEKSRESIYRSSALKHWDDAKSKSKNPFAQDDAPKMSYAERAGFIIAVVMLIYSIVNFDKPLGFMSLSLVVHFMRGVFKSEFTKNALRTFSFVLFFGAILFLFTG